MNAELDEAARRGLSEVVERLRRAEGLLAGADPASLDAACSAAGASWEALQSQPAAHAAVLSLKAQALLIRGNALRGQGTQPGNRAAIASFDEALRLWELVPAHDAAYLPNHHAKTWMSRGIALLAEGGTEPLTESVRCFDRAIALREALSAGQEPFVYYGLAAGWMNRGDALTRLGGPAGLAEAVRSYDEALRVMGKLSLDTNPLFRQRVATAWLNRGTTFEALGTESDLGQAIESFGQTIATLEHAAEVPQRQQMIAAAWMNQGNVWLKLGTARAADAREAARCAVNQLAQWERHDVFCAEIGLKARHVWCRAIASLVEQPSAAAERDALFSEATDVVDDAMAMIRDWHARGVRQFEFLAGELYRFGARVYQVYQPQFLEEFRLENLAPILAPGLNHGAVTASSG